MSAGWVNTSNIAITDNNQLTVLSVGSALNVYAGQANSTGSTAEASYNTVITSGSVQSAYGGYAAGATSATALSNSMTVSGGGISRNALSGYAWSGSGNVTASSNSMIVSGGSISQNAYSGYAWSTSGNAAASLNSMTVSGGSISYSAFSGYAWSTSGDATASSNSITVSGGSIHGAVYGGESSAMGASLASNNAVTVTGGSVSGGIFGGYTSLNNGTSSANNNTVNISGGSIGGRVSGGYSSADSGTSSANNNTVTISGGSISSTEVYGGYAQTTSGTASATGNTVTISGSPTFNAAPMLAGGGSNSPSADVFSNNRLNIWNYTGNSVGNVKNFQYYNFLLSPSFTTSSGPALNITGNLSLTNGTTSSTVEAVNFQGGGAVRNNGDVYTLLKAGSITGVITNNGQTIAGRQGAALQYNILLTQNANNTITATILSNGRGSAATLNPQMKAVSEGRTSGAIVVNQGADLVAGKGIGSAVAATRGTAQGAGAVVSSFGTMAAGSSTYHTGSHVDVSGFSLAAGIAAGVKIPWGDLTVGPFFEFGSGSYNTYNSFDNAASVTGNGSMYYMGGGLLARLDFLTFGPGHFYTEASARMGNVHNHYNNDDLQDGFGRSASFDADAPYYGLHAGAGYVWNITEALSLDMYGKYFWTRQEANSVTLSTGDRINYDAVDSNRLRLGTRMSYAVNEHFSPYVGAAFEREFNGEAEATTYGQPITAPSLRGNTGIGELGVLYKPSLNLPLTLDLGVQGYTGKRDGFTSSLQVRYEF